MQAARRHTNIALRILGPNSNDWLQAVAYNNLTGIALMESDFHAGLRHAETALAFAEASGAAAIRRACLGNLGNLYLHEGALDAARDCYRRAAAELPSGGEYNNGLLESLARTYLLEGQLEAARDCLDSIEAAIRLPADRELYANRHAEYTRGVLLHLEGRADEALVHLERTGQLAARSGDRVLQAQCLLTRAEILGTRRETEASLALLDAVVPLLPQLPAEIFGQYERVVACTLAAHGDRSSCVHRDRAARTFDGLHHRPGALELARSWQHAVAPHAGPVQVEDDDLACAAGAAAHVTQDIAALLLHAGRPELVASHAMAVLKHTRSVAGARVDATDENGCRRCLMAFGELPDLTTSPDGALRHYPIGIERGRTITLSCVLRPDLPSHVALNAVSLLLDRVHELERARLEREERLELWPLEELPVEGDEAVISGRMAEVLRVARKIAPTNASVLITGESGTGKEIVARAIHRFSTRTGRPFVPFNCTAVPRDLMESQLFGYRRGAFTGAERDHPGLIRAAKDGTLFLDEVGELALELQPKLLRFLESGEVRPLGESETLTVNARIVAATNAKLSHLIREGRFRDDLYYRLNVIPLEIPPLRERRDEIPHLARHFVTKASQEYGKGHLRIDDETLDLLGLFDWPGNVRQLGNELRRVVALADADTTLLPGMLSPEIRRIRVAPSSPSEPRISIQLTDTLASALSAVERQMIASALKRHSGQLDGAARALGISRKGLYLKRQRLGL